MVSTFEGEGLAVSHRPGLCASPARPQGTVPALGPRAVGEKKHTQLGAEQGQLGKSALYCPRLGSDTLPSRCLSARGRHVHLLAVKVNQSGLLTADVASIWQSLEHKWRQK